MKFLHLSVLGALLSIAGVAQAAPQYSATLLGAVNGHDSTFVQAYNGGIASGVSSSGMFSVDEVSTATIWTNGVASALPGLPGSLNSRAYASNLNGQTVGLSWTGSMSVPMPGLESLNQFDGHATLWNQGSATLLPGLNNSYSAAYSINNHGQVIGWSLQGKSTMVPTLWNNNTPTALGTLAGHEMYASAINDQGIVVGNARQIDSTGGNYYQPIAAYWNSQNEVQLLTGINGSAGEAYAINDQGVIIGWSNSADDRQQATIWVDGQAIDLGRLDGYSSFAYALNNKGDVVGSYLDLSQGSFDEYAVLWQNGNAINLNSLVNLPDGVVLSYGVGINDAGYIIAQGYIDTGDDAERIYRTYLLAPVPEPSSYALMLAGLALIGVSRRKSQK